MRRLLHALFYIVSADLSLRAKATSPPLPLSRLSDRRRPTNAREGQCSATSSPLTSQKTSRLRQGVALPQCSKLPGIPPFSRCNGGTSTVRCVALPHTPSLHAAFHTCPRATALPEHKPARLRQYTQDTQTRHAYSPTHVATPTAHGTIASTAPRTQSDATPTHRHPARPRTTVALTQCSEATLHSTQCNGSIMQHGLHLLRASAQIQQSEPDRTWHFLSAPNYLAFHSSHGVTAALPQCAVWHFPSAQSLRAALHTCHGATAFPQRQPPRLRQHAQDTQTSHVHSPTTAAQRTAPACAPKHPKTTQQRRLYTMSGLTRAQRCHGTPTVLVARAASWQAHVAFTRNHPPQRASGLLHTSAAMAHFFCRFFWSWQLRSSLGPHHPPRLCPRARLAQRSARPALLIQVPGRHALARLPAEPARPSHGDPLWVPRVPLPRGLRPSPRSSHTLIPCVSARARLPCPPGRRPSATRSARPGSLIAKHRSRSLTGPACAAARLPFASSSVMAAQKAYHARRCMCFVARLLSRARRLRLHLTGKLTSACTCGTSPFEALTSPSTC